MKIRELFSSPAKWTKANFAVKADGTSTTAENPEAVCWCLYGAVNKCYGKTEDNGHAVLQLMGRHLKDKGMRESGSVIGFNDDEDTTFEMVRNLVNDLDV